MKNGVERLITQSLGILLCVITTSYKTCIINAPFEELCQALMKHIIDMLIRGEDRINMVVFRITTCFAFGLCILCVRNKLLKLNQEISMYST